MKKRSSAHQSDSAFPLVMVILDGWGMAPATPGNAISFAKTPFIDQISREYPSSVLEASSSAVGLLKGQAGNSEAGHMTIGAGRRVLQDTLQIEQEIESGKFFNNPTFLEMIRYRQENPDAKIHVMSMLTSDQSAHSYPDHLYALLDFLNRHQQKKVYLHLFADGRDSGPYEGVRLIEKLMRNLKNGEIISTVIGRYYAMDRARNWNRTRTAYELLTEGKGACVDNPIKAFTEFYNHGFSDEFLPPTVICNPKRDPAFIKSGDIVIFTNCRSDRARQLAKPFVQLGFEKKGGFKRKLKLRDLHFISFTDFGEHLDHVHNAFPHVILENTLPCALAAAGIKQWYGAETEKYAHVTYFLNGGSDKSRCGEVRYRQPSKRVKKFDEVPAMSTPKLTSKALELLRKKKYQVYVMNFANPDMIAHTGNFKACVKAIEAVDQQLKRLYREVMKQHGTMIVTADHGNAEVMLDERGGIETRHNLNPVPMYLVSRKFHGRLRALRKHGTLAQVAPTLLEVIDVKKPKEMTGTSLLA